MLTRHFHAISCMEVFLSFMKEKLRAGCFSVKLNAESSILILGRYDIISAAYMDPIPERISVSDGICRF